MPPYEPTLDSVKQHPVPTWYDDAKLGIFIHWGLFSIPGFAPRLPHVSDAFSKHYRLSAVMTPYTEWYDNAIRVPESPSAAHHAKEWQGRPYADFKADFEAGLTHWDPTEWARQFKRAGARYIVLVTKHHDGFCLWPSDVRNPHQSDWTLERDVVGELAEAVRAEGIRFGVYYSGGIDWSFNRKPVRTLVEFISSVPGGAYPEYAEAQVRELIDRYKPDVLWNDITWPTPQAQLMRLFSDYYNAVPDGVVNDRWMPQNWVLKLLATRPAQRIADYLIERRIKNEVAKGTYKPGIVPPVPAHCDFRTPEYTSFPEISEKKWECTRGMSPSFGFNRADMEEHYEDPDELVRSFIDAVSKNGNLLLNVGPTGEDAAIPAMQRRRLDHLGDWLNTNGDAIFESRPWTTADGQTDSGEGVRFTVKDSTLYATVLGQPAGQEICFSVPGDFPEFSRCVRLADGQEIVTHRENGRVTFQLEKPLPAGPAHAFSFS